jgi:S-adenosylmethionine/arginine decarboxylase-like enzyme
MSEYRYSIYDMRVSDIPSPEDAERWLRYVCDDLHVVVQSSTKKIFKSPVAGHAYTIAAVLSESHAVIHTSPEDAWVEVVFAFCRPIDQDALDAKIKSYWTPERFRCSTFTCSVPKEAV